MAKLGASTALHDGEVDATNWMSALRAARQAMSERPSLPPGASCTVDAQGIATVLDPSSRRKFVLSPVASAPHPGPEAPAAQQDAPKKRFETVSLAPERSAQSGSQLQIPRPPARAGSWGPTPSSAGASPPSSSGAIAEPEAPRPPQPPKKRFATVGFIDNPPTDTRSVVVGGPGPARQEQPPSVGATRTPVPTPASRISSRPPTVLELLFERDEEPSPSNPLSYRERAYLLPVANTVPEAEAALRWKLAEFQQALESAPRGKLINLAVFDHRWQVAPSRPPVIVLQWRDWRDEIIVDYPAAARVPSVPPGPGGPQDDRLADVFEALEGLQQLRSAAEGLDFAVRLLERTIPADATSACLYDINTDELRFVAVAGIGAATMQGRAVARTAGLFGQAVRIEHHASVFDISIEPGFDPESEGRPGLEPRNEMLRPIAHEHQLLGMLQLINRKGSDTFTIHDISVVNYIAERLADFLHEARQRQRGLA